MTTHDRMVRRIARCICWTNAQQHQRDYAQRLAIAIVSDLEQASADGKAVERNLKVIEQNLERAS